MFLQNTAKKTSSFFHGTVQKASSSLLKDKKALALVAAVACLGIGLRILLINATDISGDEVFFVTYAYKIASLLWGFPLAAAALGAIGLIALYLVAVKRSLKATLLMLALAFLAKFGLGIPYLTNAPGSGVILATAATIFFTNFPPNVAGELVSTLSMIGLAFVALYWGSRQSKATGLFAFALVMLSPYNIFMSATSFMTPLGWFLAFSSLTLFFKGTEDSRFLPLSAVLAGMAFATRFTTLLLLPVFIAIALAKRNDLSKRENRSNAAIFFLVVIGTAAFLGPLVLNQFESASGWYERGGGERWDLREAHMSAFVAEAVESSILPRYDNLFIVRVMNLFYSPLFIPILAFSIAWAVHWAWKKRDLQVASLLFLGLGLFLFFFSMIMPQQRINRCLGYEFPFMMLISFALWNGTRLPRARKALGLALLVIFLAISFQTVSVHNFKGISETVEKFPEKSIVYGGEVYYTVSYYKGIYLYDLSIRKPFFDKIFKPDQVIEAAFQEKRKSVLSEPEEIEKADYAFIREGMPEENNKEVLDSFKRCKTIKNGSYDMLVFYAKETCP